MRETIYKPFNELSADVFFNKKRKDIHEELISKPKDYILGVDKNDYINYVVAKYTIEELKIDFDSEDIELYSETEKERRDERWFYEIHKYTEYVFCIKFKYTGSTEILRLQPSSYTLTISGYGSISSIDVFDNELHIFFTIYKQDKTEFNKTKEGTIKRTFENLNNVLWQVRNFNASLNNIVETEFEKIKSKYERNNSFYKDLNINNKIKNSYSISVPVLKKSITAPSFERKEKPTPVLEKATYEQILRIIYNTYKGFERLPNNYRGKDEEALRDGVLPTLQIMYPNLSPTGETFNKEGKTDICIKESGGSNVFIAECKIWNGEKHLFDAISQLLDRYVTWRDTKTALIVFVKKDSFTDIVEKAKNTIKNHPYYVRTNGSLDETSFSYIFHLPNDTDRQIYLELMLFHFVDK